MKLRKLFGCHSLLDQEKLVHVRINEDTVWVRQCVLDGSPGSLIPEYHVTNGHLDYRKCFTGDSYAAVDDQGRIFRYSEQIGMVSDLERV